jgi:t-SNARE complex subunit (syntaxin)
MPARPKPEDMPLNSRYTDSAYREVQERHEDIKCIAQTLDELAQLFNDVCYSLSGSTVF